MNKAVLFTFLGILAISGCSSMNASNVNKPQDRSGFSNPQLKMVATSEATLYSQAFGDPHDPPILLIMGGDDFGNMVAR